MSTAQHGYLTKYGNDSDTHRLGRLGSDISAIHLHTVLYVLHTKKQSLAKISIQTSLCKIFAPWKCSLYSSTSYTGSTTYRCMYCTNWLLWCAICAWSQKAHNEKISHEQQNMTWGTWHRELVLLVPIMRLQLQCYIYGFFARNEFVVCMECGLCHYKLPV